MHCEIRIMSKIIADIFIPAKIQLPVAFYGESFNLKKTNLYNSEGQELFGIYSLEDINNAINLSITTMSSYEYAHIVKDNCVVLRDDDNESGFPQELDYSDEIYTEQLSIDKLERAEAFIKKYSQFPFLLDNSLSTYQGSDSQNPYNSLITYKEYIKAVLKKIEDFHRCWKAYDALFNYYQEKDEVTARTALKLCADYYYNVHKFNDLKLAESILNYNNEDGTYTKIETSFNEIDDDQIIFDGENTHMINIDLMSGETHVFTLERGKKYLQHEMQKELIGVSFCQDIDIYGFVCSCPSILSAMYMKLQMSAYSNIRFKKCIHKGCREFFKVSNHRNQKRCEKHMEALRRKRRNAKAKEEKEKRELEEAIAKEELEEKMIRNKR